MKTVEGQTGDAELAQMVERTTLNRVVVGSIPTFGVFLFVDDSFAFWLFGLFCVGVSRGTMFFMLACWSRLPIVVLVCWCTSLFGFQEARRSKQVAPSTQVLAW